MNRTQQFEYMGKVIFQMDFTNVNSIEQIVGIINDGKDHIRSQPKGSVLTLTNITGMHFNNEIKALFQEFINENKPYVKAGAVVGINGLQQIIYNGLMKITGREIKSFPNSESAKAWLAERN